MFFVNRHWKRRGFLKNDADAHAQLIHIDVAEDVFAIE
jgi:hypothetical protein